MIAEGFLLSLIVGFLRGGRLSDLADVRISHIELFIIPFFLKALAFYGSSHYEFFSRYGYIFHLIVYIMLFMGVWYNRDNKYIVLAGLGIFLNALVIYLNGGRMPVSVEMSRFAQINPKDIEWLVSNNVATHQPITDKTLLWFLGDVIPLPKPYPFPKVISIGDVVLALGIFLYIQQQMVKRPKAKLS